MNLFDGEDKKEKEINNDILLVIARYKDILSKTTDEVVAPIKKATDEFKKIDNEYNNLKSLISSTNKEIDGLKENIKTLKIKNYSLYAFCGILILYLGYFLYLNRQNSANLKKIVDRVEKVESNTWRMMTGEVKNYWDDENAQMYLLRLEEYRQMQENQQN